MASVSGIDQSKLLAMYSSRVGSASINPAAAKAINPGHVQPVDVDAVNKLAQKNAGIKTGKVSEETKAGAASFGAAQPVQQQPQVAKVDAKTVTGIFAGKIDSPSATKYNNFAGVSAYAGAKGNGANSDYGIYDGLKSFKTSQVANNGLQVKPQNNATLGLNFGGLTNLNPNQKMFIA